MHVEKLVDYDSGFSDFFVIGNKFPAHKIIMTESDNVSEFGKKSIANLVVGEYKTSRRLYILTNPLKLRM